MFEADQPGWSGDHRSIHSHPRGPTSCGSSFPGGQGAERCEGPGSDRWTALVSLGHRVMSYLHPTPSRLFPQVEV